MITAVADDVQRPRRAGLRRRQTGERLGGFIYGTILVLAVIIAGAKAFEHEAGHIAGLVAVTVVVFWLAHVYADALAHSVAYDQHLSLTDLRRIAHREASMLEAAVPPLVALLLGAVGIVSTTLAVWVAFGLGLGVLCAQGITFARVERMGRLGTFAVVAANLGLGVALVGLKLLVSH
jgi:hypothetical protein